MQDTRAGRWLDVNSAADELGVSTDAVRKRIARGSLRSERTDAGVRVWLDGGGSEAGREAHGEVSALVEVLTEQAAYLREQLAEEREARRRADTIIAQLTQTNTQLSARVLELDSPVDPLAPPQRSEDVPEGSENGSGDPRPSASGGGPQNASGRAPWWRRVFGG